MAGGKKSPTTFGLQNRRGAFVEIPAFAAYVLVALGPMLLLIGKAALSGRADWLRLAVPTGRTLTLFLNSLVLALAISAVSMCLGWLGATMFWIWRSRTTTPIIWLVLPLAALPPYIHALAWLTLSATINTWLRTLGWSAGIGQGWASVLWVGTATYAPLALGFAWLGLRSIDPDLIDAGRQVHPDLDVLLRIVLPLSIPATLTAGGIIFLLNILDYSVPYLFQVNVYAMEVFAEYSASNLPERAGLIALPLLVIASGVLVAALEPLRTLAMREVRHRPVWDNKPSLARSFLWLAGVACALLIAQALLPIVMLVTQSGAPRELIETVGQARAEVGY
jgi:iron(III) transport system permease protein